METYIIFSSATEHAEELEHNIDVILQAQDVSQCQHPGEQNRNEERYGEDTLISLVAEWNSLEVQYLLSRFIIS